MYTKAKPSCYPFDNFFAGEIADRRQRLEAISKINPHQDTQQAGWTRLKFKLHRGVHAVAGALASRMLHAPAGPIRLQSTLEYSTKGDAVG